VLQPPALPPPRAPLGLLRSIAVEHFNLFAILIVAIDILNAILKKKKK
jgi:hypothetical protein